MKTLVLTVGGSATPLLTAIDTYKPDRVVFLCSDDDPVSQRPGSYTAVLSHTEDFSPSQPPRREPALPARAGLAEGSWSLERIPADRLDAALPLIVAVLDKALAEGAVIADYTGGTKTMSAAMVLAGTVRTDVTLSLTTGARVDHIKVTGGARARGVKIDGVRVERALADVRLMARRFDFDGIVRQLDVSELDSPLLERARGVAEGLLAWDRQDYETALAALRPFSDWTGGLLPTLARLARARQAGDWGPSATDEAAWICDLRFAADRRALTGRHDLAVLLAYRVVERIAQWTLKFHHDLDTSNVVSTLPVVLELAELNHKGQRVLGAYRAWKLIGLLDGPLKAAALGLLTPFGTLAELRNHSYLTHGARPLDAQASKKAVDWLDHHLWPAFMAAAGKFKPAPLPIPSTLPGLDP